MFGNAYNATGQHDPFDTNTFLMSYRLITASTNPGQNCTIMSQLWLYYSIKQNNARPVEQLAILQNLPMLTILKKTETDSGISAGGSGSEASLSSNGFIVNPGVLLGGASIATVCDELMSKHSQNFYYLTTKWITSAGGHAMAAFRDSRSLYLFEPDSGLHFADISDMAALAAELEKRGLSGMKDVKLYQILGMK